MIVPPEENIVNGEEEFAESECLEHDDDAYVPYITIEERVVAVAPLNDVEIEIANITMPR